MSLISDALRKTQPPPEPPPPGNKSRWIFGAIVMGAVGLVLTLVAYLPKTSSSLLPATAGISSAKRTPSAHPAGLRLLRSARSGLSLNGIVRGSDGESLALINGQVVSEGTIIGGAKVVRVDRDYVELREGDNVRTLTLQD